MINLFYFRAATENYPREIFYVGPIKIISADLVMQKLVRYDKNLRFGNHETYTDIKLKLQQTGIVQELVNSNKGAEKYYFYVTQKTKSISKRANKSIIHKFKGDVYFMKHSHFADCLKRRRAQVKTVPEVYYMNEYCLEKREVNIVLKKAIEYYKTIIDGSFNFGWYNLFYNRAAELVRSVFVLLILDIATEYKEEKKEKLPS